MGLDGHQAPPIPGRPMLRKPRRAPRGGVFLFLGARPELCSGKWSVQKRAPPRFQPCSTRNIFSALKRPALLPAGFIEPCKPTFSTKAPSGPEWIHDGLRHLPARRMTDHRGAAGLCRDVLSISPTAGLGLPSKTRSRTIPRSRVRRRARGVPTSWSGLYLRGA
jgi:hypothetical protein